MVESKTLSVEEVSKTYGYWKPYQALKAVSFSLAQGQVCGLLGPNGAGKTTLIKSILGLAKPDSGKIEVFGASSMSVASRERIGFLPEESYLYSFMDIQETIRFASSLYKSKGGGASRKALTDMDVRSAMDFVGLAWEVRSRKISQCSKGMRRRVALAQALIHDPELVVLDEPTSGFDPMGIAMMKSIIRKLRDRGCSVLLCSHQLGEVQDLCDHVVILDKGEVLAQGSIDDLLTPDHFHLKFEDEAQWKMASEYLREKGLEHESRSFGDLEEFFIALMQQRV